MKISAGVFEKIVDGETDVNVLLNPGDPGYPKYKRWFFATRDGGLWIADIQLYTGEGYSDIVVVFRSGYFPKYDRVTGEFVGEMDSKFPYPWSDEPDMGVLAKYHAEEVEIVGDEHEW